MNSENTITSIRDSLITFLKQTNKTSSLVVMDNALPHTSQKTIKFMKNNNINFIPFGGSPCNVDCGYPPNSPDFNAIEGVFSTWDNKIAMNNPQTIDELINVAKLEWNNITLDEIRKHIIKVKKAMKYAIDFPRLKFLASHPLSKFLFRLPSL